MKLKAKQRSAQIPGDIDQLLQVTWHPDVEEEEDPVSYAVWLLNPQEMAAKINADPPKDPAQGVVQYACLIGDEVIVWPLPRVAGNLKVTYFPHRKEA